MDLSYQRSEEFQNNHFSLISGKGLCQTGRMYGVDASKTYPECASTPSPPQPWEERGLCYETMRKREQEVSRAGGCGLGSVRGLYTQWLLSAFSMHHGRGINLIS